MHNLELDMLSDADHVAMKKDSSRRDFCLLVVVCAAADELAVDIGARSRAAVSNINHGVVLVVEDDGVELELQARHKRGVDDEVTSTSKPAVPKQLTWLNLLVRVIPAYPQVVIGVQKKGICGRGG